MPSRKATCSSVKFMEAFLAVELESMRHWIGTMVDWCYHSLLEPADAIVKPFESCGSFAAVDAGGERASGGVDLRADPHAPRLRGDLRPDPCPDRRRNAAPRRQAAG